MGLTDSPVGVAAWIIEKFGVWADLPTTEDGSPDVWRVFSEDLLLTNIMLYVATNAFATSTWIYQGEQMEGSYRFAPGARVDVPTGVAAFPDPVFPPPPRSHVEKTYRVVHWTDMPAGGHFAALEQPDRFLADLRAFIAAVLN
jgi:pimeloyl-ACP methyl ester carboxylesterase